MQDAHAGVPASALFVRVDLVEISKFSDAFFFSAIHCTFFLRFGFRRRREEGVAARFMIASDDEIISAAGTALSVLFFCGLRDPPA